MNICTFEKAKALKSANFPQPKWEFGQLWYSSNGDLWIIGRLSPNADCVAVAIQDTRWEHLHDTTGFVFAPTATDILSLIDSSDLYFSRGTWQASDQNNIKSGWHEKPVEACADVFLSVSIA